MKQKTSRNKARKTIQESRRRRSILFSTWDANKITSPDSNDRSVYFHMDSDITMENTGREGEQEAYASTNEDEDEESIKIQNQSPAKIYLSPLNEQQMRIYIDRIIVNVVPTTVTKCMGQILGKIITISGIGKFNEEIQNAIQNVEVEDSIHTQSLPPLT